MVDLGGSAAGRAVAPYLQQGTDILGKALRETVDRFATVDPRPSAQGLTQPVSSLSSWLPRIDPVAAGAQSHLLILTSTAGDQFYFGLPTAAFETLKRTTQFNVAAQARLQREEALQAVNKAGDTITLAGAIFTVGPAGGRQLNVLRRIASRMQPVDLATGYGDVLGRWMMTQIEEEQSVLFSDGAPKKQTFSLEFRRYGDDYQNV